MCALSCLIYTCRVIKKLKRMVKILMKYNRIIRNRNVNANKEVKELKKLLIKHIGHIKDLTDLIVANSESCKTERFYALCLKRFSIGTDKFILEDAPQLANSLHNDVLKRFLENKRQLTEKEIIVCSLMLLDFSTSFLHILCKYKDVSCIYTLSKRLKDKLEIKDAGSTLKQYLRRLASSDLQ